MTNSQEVRSAAESTRSTPITSDAMPVHSGLVFVVDDDPHVRSAVENLASSAGLCVVTFSSAEQFLGFCRPQCPACIVMDVNLPGVNALDLQRCLKRAQAPPVIFLSRTADVSLSVRAIKSGALDFMQKPFNPKELLSAVEAGILLDARRRAERSQAAELNQRYARLTPREREVLPFVITGFLNKQTAAELGTSEVTVRVHRGQIMRKMRAQSLPDLVRMADRLKAGRLNQQIFHN